MLVVYGVVRGGHPDVCERGVANASVSIVRQQDLGAVVSELADDDELLARRRDVSAYMTVLERAHGAGDVLPFRFGTVVRDAEELRVTLAARADSYRHSLDELSGLVQVTVKVVRSDDEAVRAVVASDARVRRWASALAGSSRVADQLELGERMAAEVAALTERDVADVVARLTPYAEATSIDEPQPPTVLSLALLVRRDSLGRLDQAAAGLFDTYGSRLQFDYAGPMPPFSFVAG